MFEVKVYINYSGLVIPVTVARFEMVGEETRARNAAVRWAKHVEPGFAVDVVNVADEDYAEKAFGLVYHRDAEF